MILENEDEKNAWKFIREYFRTHSKGYELDEEWMEKFHHLSFTENDGDVFDIQSDYMVIAWLNEQVKNNG